MILSGWKEIAQYLKCAVRSAQRWERLGLPVRRPYPGRRAAVIADSEDLDSWRRDNPFWRRNDLDILASVQRARQLRKQVKEARELLRSRMNALKNELADIHKKARTRSAPTRSERYKAS